MLVVGGWGGGGGRALLSRSSSAPVWLTLMGYFSGVTFS